MNGQATPWRRAFAVWALIIAVESLHGAVRQLWIAPALGERLAHQVGMLTGSALIFLIAWLSAR